MTRVETPHRAALRYAAGSLQRFLTGKAAGEGDHSLTLSWVVGVIGSTRVRGAELMDMLDRNGRGADQERFEQVRAECERRGWLW